MLTLPKPSAGFLPPPAAAKMPEKETKAAAAAAKAGAASKVISGESLAGTKRMTKVEMQLAASNAIGADSVANTHGWLQTDAAAREVIASMSRSARPPVPAEKGDTETSKQAAKRQRQKVQEGARQDARTGPHRTRSLGLYEGRRGGKE